MSTNGRHCDRRHYDIVESPSTDAIQSLIKRTRRLLRSAWTTTGLSVTCGIFLSALLLVTVVDLATPLSTVLRVAGWLVVFVSGAAAFASGVVLPLLRRLTPVNVAHRIESHLPGIHNRLVSCVELANDNSGTASSTVFHRRLVTEALQRIRDFQPQNVLDLRLLKRAAVFAGSGIAAFVFAALIFGDRMPTAVARIVNPLADIPPYSGVVYDVLIDDRDQSGDCNILRGEDVEFTVVLREGKVDPPGGTDPLRLELDVTDEEGSLRHVRYDFGQLQDNRVSLTLNGMQHPCSYRVRGGGTWSKRYAITLLDRPRITAVQSAVYFPEYMRINQPRISADDSIDITGPTESRVEIRVELEGDVSEGEIELLAPDNDGEFKVVEAVAMQPAESGTKWQGSFGLTQDGFYRIVLRNSLGYSNRRMKEGKLTAVPDNPPQVALARPTEDIVVTSPMEIPVQAAAFDDFGLDDISLVVEHSYWGQTRQAHPFDSGQPPRNQDVLFVLDLAEQRLRRDDRIECRLEARDTKGQVAVSESFSVRVANQREAADRELVDLREQLDTVESMLASLVREQKRADEIISELAAAQGQQNEPAPATDHAPQQGTPSDEAPTDRGADDIWERESEEQVDHSDDIWEREHELAELAHLEEQNAALAEQLAEALRRAAEQAAETQLLPTPIAEQIAAAERAVEPTVQQPLEQLELMTEQMAQANHDQATAAERLSDHLQDNLEDLQARIEAIQQAQEDSQQDIEQALADFEQELTEQSARAAARELSELGEFVDELRENLADHHAQQSELVARNDSQLPEPALEALAEQQERLQQQAREDLQDARELLDADPIDDLAQEPGSRENGESGNPFEPMEEGSVSEDTIREDAGSHEEGFHEEGDEGESELWEEGGSDAKSKEPSFKPAIDGSKKPLDEPFDIGVPEHAGPDHGTHEREAAGGEEPGSWEEAFEAAAEPGAPAASQGQTTENGDEMPSESESGQPEAGAEGSETHPSDSTAPRARLASQQQLHAEQLSSAAESLAADQQTLNELISGLSQTVNSQQPANSQSTQQLSQLLNSPAMLQAMAMQQRMNAMQLPPSVARSATAQLAQSQPSPEGARTMSGAVEQILVELGETAPNAASLLMRMQPHQREDLLQGLRQGGPKGYRKFIRDYFIRLSQAGATQD